jgi:uncharacterized protein
MSAQADDEAQPYPLGRAIVRLRWVLILLSVAGLVASGWGLGHLTFNPDNRVFFASDNPDRRALDALEQTYSRNDGIIFVVAPKDGKVFSQSTLSLIEEMTRRSWQLPFSTRVDSITNFQYTFARGDELVVQDLVTGADKKSDQDLLAIQETALGLPEIVNMLVSEKADVTGVFVNLTLQGESNDETRDVMREGRALVEDVKARWPEVDFYILGSVAVDMAFAEASKRDGQYLMPIMFLALIAIIGFSLRSTTGTIITTVVIFMSGITALGLWGWTGIPLNSVTAAAAIIIVPLSVANCVHVLTTFRHAIRRGLDRKAAVVDALRVEVTPITITTVTTAIGFLSLNFSDSPPIQELGNIVAMGVVAAFLYAIFFLAPMMAVLPARGGSKGVPRVTVMDKLGDAVVARRWPLLVGTSTMIAILAAGVTRIQLDDDYLKYFDDSFEIRQGTVFMEERLTGVNSLEFSLPGGGEQGIARPEYLRDIERFANWLREHPRVSHVSVLTDIMKRLNSNLHEDDPAYYRIPESREAAAQYLLLYELSLPYGLDLNNRIDVSKSHSRMSVVLADIAAAETLELADEAEAWLQENTPELASRATGLSVVYGRLTLRNMKAMLRGTLLSLLLISGILLVVLRSVRVGLISLAPNLFPAAVAFGIWGYLFQEVNLAISIVVAMTLGIVVDDTVHFLSKYLTGKRVHGLDAEGAVRFAFRSVGKALWVTTIALVVGFSVLATSGFAVNGATGLLCAITLVVALIADFFFLPPLLMWLDRDRQTS